jgi:1-acyl-sn-glycerol-3-phosphate acyltransferase
MSKKPKKQLPMPKIKSAEKSFSVRFAASILIPLVRSMFRLEVEGIEKLPKKGSFILVANHVTNVDALAVAYFIYRYLNRGPHFLAKESLFRIPVIGQVITAAGQIPVYRSTHRNDGPLRAANQYLAAGHCIAIFPEGTLTRDPELWPMRGRSGAVRLALETNVPVYAIAHWGSEQILPTYGAKFRPNPFKKVRILVGGEIDLAKYRKKQLTPTETAEATELVMDTITALVEKLRGEKAPNKRWDAAEAGQAAHGNFKKPSKTKRDGK